MTSSPKKLLIIGAGIAGSSVAYFAARAGYACVLIDAGIGTTSRVPSALLNPVRGQGGQLVAHGLEGMDCTWELVAALEGQGYSIPHGQNSVYRPLPDAATREKWQAKMPLELEHTWLEPSEIDPAWGLNLQSHWHSVFQVKQGGWLEGAALIEALRHSSGAELIRGTAQSWTAHSVTLEAGDMHGDVLTGDEVIWCGGSWGAWLAGIVQPHRRGSVLLLDQPLSQNPVSFGIYSTPAAKGGVLGATYETPEASWSGQGLPLSSLEWLISKAKHTFQTADFQTVYWRGIWTGSRLGGNILSGKHPAGHWQLGALGSKGFLLGPLLARGLVEQISNS